MKCEGFFSIIINLGQVKFKLFVSMKNSITIKKVESKLSLVISGVVLFGAIASAMLIIALFN